MFDILMCVLDGDVDAVVVTSGSVVAHVPICGLFSHFYQFSMGQGCIPHNHGQ